MISKSKQFIYSSMVFTFPVAGVPIFVYILPFYASNYNLGLSLVGFVFFAGRMIDVFTDPIMGALVDKFPSKWGKHKHWIILSLPVLFLSMYFLFLPPEKSISGWYLFICLFFLYTGFTLSGIAQLSWASFIAPNYDDRTRLLTFREFFSLVSTLCVISIPAIIEIFGGDFESKINAIGIFGLIGIPITIIFGVTLLPDKKKTVSSPNPFASYKRFLSNKSLNILVLASVLIAFGQSFTGGLYLMLIDAVLELEAFASRAILINFIFAIIGLFFWRYLGIKLSKHKSAAYCCFYASLALFLQFLLIYALLESPASIKILGFFPMVAIVGFAFSGAAPLINSMVADLSDQDEFEEQTNQSGSMYAYLTTITKIGFTFAIAAPYIFLENVLGFDITLGSLNSDTSITGLFYMYHFLPIVCNLVAGFVLLQYTLKRSQHEIIRNKLHSKNYD